VPEVLVVPLVGETASQLLPVEVEAVAVKGRAAPLPETLMVCAAGAVPPEVKVNVRLVGDAETVAAGVSVKVTGKVTAWPPVGVIVTVPL
jgi:hypothetical protein